MSTEREKRIINRFVERYGRLRNVALKVTGWPDDRRGTTCEIDAVLECEPVPIAIELTSVDAIPNQRRDEDHVRRVCDGLKEALAGEFEGTVVIGIKPNTIDAGADAEMQKAALIGWLRRVVPSLSYSTTPVPYEECWHTDPELPCPVNVVRLQSDIPAVDLYESDKPRRQPEDISDQISKKLAKLEPYKREGYHTILLVENDDVSLMNADEMRRILLPALQFYPGPPADEVCYADTSTPLKRRYYPISSPESSTMHET